MQRRGEISIVTVPQGYGTLNTVTPQFTSLALQDEWRPNDKLDLNVGVRFESYVYNLPSADNPEYNFWFAQAANAYCYDPGTGQPILTPVPIGSSPANAGPQVLPNAQGLGEKAGLCYNPGGTPFISPSGKQALHPNGQDGSALYTNQQPAASRIPSGRRVSAALTRSPPTPYCGSATDGTRSRRKRPSSST